jgi:hypothetical protein
LESAGSLFVRYQTGQFVVMGHGKVQKTQSWFSHWRQSEGEIIQFVLSSVSPAVHRSAIKDMNLHRNVSVCNEKEE